MDALDAINALLITDPVNIRYLTGFVGAAPEEREAYCLLAQNNLFLFTNALYIEQAKNLKSQIPNLKSKKLQVIEISREDPLSKKLQILTAELNIKTLGFEEINLSYAEYRKLIGELPNVKLVGTQNRIEARRQIKRDNEVAVIRKAAQITDACFGFILGKLKPGVTESEIAWEIESFCRRNGATSAFSPIAAFGKNSSMPHYGGENNAKLTNNQIVLLDFGARYDGYCSDMTRMVFVGKPNNEWKTAYAALLEAQQKALDLLAGGERSGAKLDEAARQILTKHNLPLYPHSLGHGVGLAIHESPRLSYKKDIALKSGMAITIEPGVYIEGQFGIRIEDLVYIGDNGMEILSQSPKTLTIIAS